MNIHKTTIHVRCPYQPGWDYHQAEFSTEQMIQCEQIDAACDELRGKKLTQEDAVMMLRRLLPEHVKIRLVCHHGPVLLETTR